MGFEETAITNSIKEFFKKNLPRESFYWKISDRYTRGRPDLVLLTSNSKTMLAIFFEVKKPSEKARKVQDYFFVKVKHLGDKFLSKCHLGERSIHGYVVRSADDVKVILEDLGVIDETLLF